MIKEKKDKKRQLLEQADNLGRDGWLDVRIVGWNSNDSITCSVNTTRRIQTNVQIDR